MEIDYKLRKRIRELVMGHPNEVINALLTSSFWPGDLEHKIRYTRMGDDDRSMIAVAFSDDGDGWIEIAQELDHDRPEPVTRFRTGMTGGGMSHATRNGLLILAVAMMRDNRNFPQRK